MAAPTNKGTSYYILAHLLMDAQDAGINPEAHATSLLSGFLNDDRFVNDALQGLNQNIIDAIQAIPKVPTRWDSTANDLVEAALSGNTDELGDLADAPKNAEISLEQIDAFRTNAFYQNLDPDLRRDRDAPNDLRRLASIKGKILAAEDSLNGAAEIQQISIKGNIVSLKHNFEQRLSEFTGPEREIADNLVFPEEQRLPVTTIEQKAPEEETPTVAAADLSKEEIIAKFHELQALDSTVTLDIYKQGFILLNPDNQGLFDAIENAGGSLVNPLKDQLLTALNEDPTTLNALIELSEDSEKIKALTTSIESEAGSTDFVLALAKANGEAPLSINPHAATPLEGPDIRNVEEVVEDPILPLKAVPTLPVQSEELGPATAPEDKPVIDGDNAAAPAIASILPESITSLFSDSAENSGEIANSSNNALTSQEGADMVNTTIASLPSRISQHFSDMTGIDYTVASAAVQAENNQTTQNTYTVEKGDNLWKIAKGEYDLTSYKDVMRAVDHIAHANGLDKGTDANWIKPGMEINMPNANDISKPIDSLDWKALDNDPKLGAAARANNMALTN